MENGDVQLCSAERFGAIVQRTNRASKSAQACYIIWNHHTTAIPAKAGIQGRRLSPCIVTLVSRFRGNDVVRVENPCAAQKYAALPINRVNRVTQPKP